MPDAPSIQRKLAAILAADAVGYSRLMARDEEETMRVLSGHRTVIDGIIAFHSGRIVGTAGDSVLAEFASPVEALRCAVEIQAALKTRNEGVPEDRRMQFRIGINLGDVMVKGDDLLGDGVNVAARLEGIASPGGICISSSVYDQIAGKLDLGFRELGEKSLKNIDRPVRVYSVQPGGSGVRRGPVTRRTHYALAVLVAIAAVAAAWWHWAGPDVAPIASPAPAVAASPAELASHALQARVTQLERHAAAAREEDERRLAAARSDAERSQEEARIAAVRAKAAEEIANARSEAELAKARADAEAMRRQAAAELAAARKPTPSQPPTAQHAVLATSLATSAPAATPMTEPAAKAAPAKPAPAVQLAIADPQAPPASATPAPGAAGAWSATLHCDSIFARGGRDVVEELTEPVRVRMDDGAFVVERRAPRTGGHLLLRGTPSQGKLVLTGTVIPPRGRERGEEVPVRLEGPLQAGGYRTEGELGRRHCTVDLARR